MDIHEREIDMSTGATSARILILVYWPATAIVGLLVISKTPELSNDDRIPDIGEVSDMMISWAQCIN